MYLGGTQECKQRIIEFLDQGPPGIIRLREVLPLLFDSHRILTTESQMNLLRMCSLSPILSRSPWHQVTFETHRLEMEPLTSWVDRNPAAGSSACVLTRLSHSSGGTGRD